MLSSVSGWSGEGAVVGESGVVSGPDIAERLGIIVAPKKKRKWWKRKRVWIPAIIVALVGAYFAFHGPKPVTYVTQPMTRGTLDLTVSATGTLAPRVKVTVGAEVSGRIDALYVDFNDHVTKGQKLAQINTEATQAQLSQARANLAQAQATLKLSQETLARDEALMKAQALSPLAFDNAKADQSRAQAGVDQAQAQVQAYETALTKATIYAPIDGVVLDRKVSVGQTVAAAFNTPELFTLASDLTQMELDVNIDEADVGEVHEGQEATFAVDAYPDKKFAAKLISVHANSQTVQNVVTYQGVLIVNNKDLLLKPGMTATAEILTGRVKNAILVPNPALRFVPAEAITKAAPPLKMEPGLARVWTKSGKSLKPHDLKLGGSNGLLTVVLKGDLKPGDQVVTDTKTGP
ncbi:MAG: efflux RND transporter periplasmic adaptor subunit [Alphaproteobacteria bacterium]|nr:efflux RND transporter periplasmic adaptor subunit [Alphaproteobacteria bacterium]